ncbi:MULTISPECIES: DUF6756 family protein [unclassified Chelatococcus]|uniref:DUF6756 family protein n=1 Tax=unclassified Chelatococcus TaxID=2638111 RepID=UPI001BCECED7|nr:MULTISPECIES: DUF6756 family protein [unclassified Chelatococcus]MBS7696234.1 hypothetical protein [Chelatococcus sp. YT9]MBS7697571.1 hypothetical protein [Chelatococcus sp. YT9]MBX3560118.1 hypothetical protein [Chelatococcus sp.]
MTRAEFQRTAKPHLIADVRLYSTAEVTLYDLVADVRASVERHSMVEMPVDQAADFVHAAKTTFLKEDVGWGWWWESLSQPTFHVVYQASLYSSVLLPALLGPKAQVVLIVPTGTPRQATPAFTGTAEELVEVLNDLPMFEFVIVDPHLKWIICDMHDGVLCFCGAVTVAE